MAYTLAKNLEDEDEDKTDAFNLFQKIETNNKNRTLLLIDGYDEVRHLNDEDYFKEIMKAITEKGKYHVIMTSRPNAVDKDLRSKFKT